MQILQSPELISDFGAFSILKKNHKNEYTNNMNMVEENAGLSIEVSCAFSWSVGDSPSSPVLQTPDPKYHQK